MNFADYPRHIALLTEAALQAADPAAAVTAHLSRHGRQVQLGSHRHTLPENGRIFLIAVGKAAVPMSLAALDQLGDLFSAGLVVVKDTLVKETDVDWHGRLHDAGYGRLLESHEEQPPPLRFFVAGHPLPNEVSLAAANAAAHLLADTTPDDLVICLISGGTSALLSQPRLPLPVWRRLHEALLASGCTIQELNQVRRQLDSIKGGGLARLAAPATCAGLILSDVVGSNLLDIGSGPTVMTDETAETALTVLQRYDMPARLETAVWQTIHAYLTEAATQPDIDPSGHTIPLGRVHNKIVGDGQMAATAVLARAAQLGFVPQLLTTHLQGEAREVGYVAAALARDAAPNRCFIMAGETTVTLRGDGRGGRNQELALAAALALDGVPGRVIASFATDGEDGPTPAAGAIITGQTAELARHHGLEPRHFLARNDSHTFFGHLDEITGETGMVPVSLITTGSTGTNVNDILLILTYE
jgi:glycerate 2-kinase